MTNNYPSDWDSRRKKVYSRDDHECQNCGIGGEQNSNIELHAHHIVPVSKGGSHDMSNLVTVCDQCHSSIHNDNEESRNTVTNSEIVDGLNPEDHEGIERAIVEISILEQEKNETVKKLNNSLEMVGEYVEKAFKYVDEPGSNMPDKLASAYIRRYQECREALSEFRSFPIQAKDIINNYDFNPEAEEAMRDYIRAHRNQAEKMEEVLDVLESIASIDNECVILNVASPNSIEWEVNLQVAFDDMKEANQQARDAGDQMKESVRTDLSWF